MNLAVNQIHPVGAIPGLKASLSLVHSGLCYAEITDNYYKGRQPKSSHPEVLKTVAMTASVESAPIPWVIALEKSMRKRNWKVELWAPHDTVHGVLPTR